MMNREKAKQLHRNKTRAKERAKKRQLKKLKSIKKLISKSKKKNPVNNMVNQLKEQQSPSFSRTAYQQNNSIHQLKKNVLKDDKFKISKWQPPSQPNSVKSDDNTVSSFDTMKWAPNDH